MQYHASHTGVIAQPYAPNLSDEENENDWVIMAGSEFSARPASKRAIERLPKFEVKESHLLQKEAVEKETKQNKSDKKCIEPVEGAGIVATKTCGGIQITKKAETNLCKTPGKIQNSEPESLAGGNKTGSEKKNVCSKNNIPDKVDSCTICLCSFEVGDMASKLPCGHIFHCECVEQ